MVEDLIKDETTAEGSLRRCLKHTLRGNVLWTVWEITRADGSMWRYIGCDLLQCQRGFGWGYKDLTEADGPYYYSCPPIYLALVPEANAEWREAVRAQHERIPVGSRLTFKDLTIPEATVVEVKGRTLIVSHRNQWYRIPPRLRLCITNIESPLKAAVAC
ncbi:MAG: hypothetical protein ACRERU_14675 [Methylococcales bacterium]